MSIRAGSIADNGSGGLYGYRMSKAALNMGAVSLTRDLAPKGLGLVVVELDDDERQADVTHDLRCGTAGAAIASDDHMPAQSLIGQIELAQL